MCFRKTLGDASIYLYYYFLPNLGYAKEYRGIPLAPPMTFRVRFVRGGTAPWPPAIEEEAVSRGGLAAVVALPELGETEVLAFCDMHLTHGREDMG